MQTPTTFAALFAELGEGEATPCHDFSTAEGTLSRDTRAVWAIAQQRGRQLRALGLRAGDRVALIVTDPWEFLPLVHACLSTGLVAVPVYPPPLFTRAASYDRVAAGILETAKTRTAIVDRHLVGRLDKLSDASVLSVDELRSMTEDPAPLEHMAQPCDLALLQFTSGSTARPRGVRITHQALMANIRSIMVDGLGASHRDRGVSWLPLYHDMGLIGFGLAPLLTRTPVTFVPTARFIRQPSSWLSTVTEYGATITFAPNFAYSLVTRRVSPAGLLLDSVRMWGCGSEPISEKVLSAFESKFACAGLKPGCVAPCYGLAEATLAVSFTPPSTSRASLALDRDALETQGEVQQGRRNVVVVACGQPLPGHTVRILDAEGCELGPNRVGEVAVGGPSLGDGYEGDPLETARVFTGSEVRTGDRGFMADGRLFITGRIKDMIVVNGRKYDPHVLEEWAETVVGVRRAAVVGVFDGEGETAVALLESGNASESLAESVRAEVAAHAGLSIARVLFVGPGSLPRTTSGKLKRSAARALANELLAAQMPPES